MLRSGFLGLLLYLKTLNYLYIGAYHYLQLEPEASLKKYLEPKPFLKMLVAGAVASLF